MTNCRLIFVLLTVAVVPLSHAERSHMVENRMGWLSNRVNGVKQRDVYPYYLWELYKSSSTFERPKVAKKIQDAMTNMAYLDSRIYMLGLILFGPKNHWSFLRAVRDENRPIVDDLQCLKSTLKLFEKHCGVLTAEDMKQSLANMCRYVVEKAAIKEAIIIVCGMLETNTESHVIDVVNPKANVTPSPIRGTFEYCGRVVVNGVLRSQLQSYANAYQVTVIPAKRIHDRWHNLIQICFHQNDSQGLCQCEEDDWTFLQMGSWSSVMSPYEQWFVDVKFVVDLEGFVTVTLKEVSQKWRYGLLVGGLVLLLMAVSKDKKKQFVKWAMRVLAVTCIFMSSNDTPLAVVAACFSLALCDVITSISSIMQGLFNLIGRIPVLSKKTTLWPRNGPGQGTVAALRGEGCSSTLHKIPNRKKHVKKDWTRQSIADLASTPEFEHWVSKNAHRIKLPPNNGLDD